MKHERKKQIYNNRRRSHLMDLSLAERNNQIEIKENTDDILNQTLPASNQKRNSYSARLSKNFLQSARGLNYLISPNKNICPRISKLNAMNSLNIKKNIPIFNTNNENFENKPFLGQQKTTLNRSLASRNRSKGLNPLNSLVLNYFDETSNNSTGASSDYSVDSSTSNSNSSDNSLITYSLNLPNEYENSFLAKLEPKLEEKHVEIKTNPTETNSLVEEKKEKMTKKISLSTDQVIVPNFRIKNFKPRYRIEGCENMSDEAYSKRHQKLENEEIKIQKWDIKRQKEEFEKNKALEKEKKPSTKLVNNNKAVTPLNLINDSNEPIILTENDMYIIEVIDGDQSIENGSTTNINQSRITLQLILTNQESNPVQSEKAITKIKKNPKRSRTQNKKIIKNISINGIISNSNNISKKNRQRLSSPIRNSNSNTFDILKTRTRSIPLNEQLILDQSNNSISSNQPLAKRRKF